MVPFFMILLFAANIVISEKGFYHSFLIVQTVFYLLAMIGWATYKNKSKRFIVKLISRVASTALRTRLMRAWAS